MWCTSVNNRCPHPGNRHPRSCARTARFTARDPLGLLAHLIGLPSLSTSTAMNGASHAIRRAVSGDSPGPSSSSQRPSVSLAEHLLVDVDHRRVPVLAPRLAPFARYDSAIATTARPSGPGAGGSAEPSPGDTSFVPPPTPPSPPPRPPARVERSIPRNRRHPRRHRRRARVPVVHTAPLLLEVDPARYAPRCDPTARPLSARQHHQIRLRRRRRHR